MATLKQITECNKAATAEILKKIRAGGGFYEGLEERLLAQHPQDVHDVVDVVISTFEKNAPKAADLTSGVVMP